MTSELDPRRTAAILVVSTSAAAGEAEDRTGLSILSWLTERGFDVSRGVRVVADGDPFGDALTRALAERPDLIVTTGGTGLSPDDRTPELTAPHVDRPVPGILEEVRRRGVEAGVPAAPLTRGVAGFAGDTFVVNLPGSPGAVADGLAVLDSLLEHLLAQHAGRSGRESHA